MSKIWGYNFFGSFLEIICPADFDGLSCWTATPANQTAYRQCPDYLNLFDSEGRIVAAHISHIHLI